MADMQRPSLVERDTDQAITALKKGTHLLKYGRRGKPKFCPFRLSADESNLIWYYGKDEKQLELRHVSQIIPGQRTLIFQRYPRPEKEYQSFSLIYKDRSLDLICKDKDEAEVWFAGLKALILRGSNRKRRNESNPESPRDQRVTPSNSSPPRDQVASNTPQSRLGKAFADVLSYTSTTKYLQPLETISHHLPVLLQPNGLEGPETTVRASLSSAVSSSSQGSCVDDFDNLGDVFIWGEGIARIDSLSPKPLESTVMLDVHRVACGRRHAALVTKQGEVFTWGEEEGGRLGHGVDFDFPHPKLVRTLSDRSIEMVACGDHHTCAVSVSGELFAWGDGTHWVPTRVGGPVEGLQVAFVSCGPWHTAVVTDFGRLFTFGDGAFGALGHGDRGCCDVPREVDCLKGLKTVKVGCGVWHTAAVVEMTSELSDRALSGNLFSWGDGDEGQLGHEDSKPRLVPECVASLVETDFSQVVCGDNFTVALSNSGRVYTMGSSLSDGKIEEGTVVDEIACGSRHVAVLTSNSDVYTWGKGSNGQLGHGDVEDRTNPTLVEALKDKQVKSIACGSNFTAVVCVHKWISTVDSSACSGCRNMFSFMRKRHNCYNCGLVFCKACTTRRSIKASLGPSASKPYRVCDDCFVKLQKVSTERDGKGNISRLSSAERNFSLNTKFELGGDNRLFPIRVGNATQRPSTSSKSPTSPFRSSQSFLSFFVPDSRRVSRSPSPVPAKTPRRSTTRSPSATPFRLSETNLDDLKSGGEGLCLEVKSLRTQVESLASKSQLLEAELERKTKLLKKMIAQAAEEAEKSRAANDTIKSLTAQLKEMAEKVPMDEQVDGGHSDRLSNGSSVTSPKSDSSDNSNTAQPTNRTTPRAKKSKRIVQEEPGVYITLVTFPDGENELRRVRFSRKLFTEEEAEKWWAENGTRVCDKHNVRVLQ